MGEGVVGDIALDDVWIEHKPCQPPGACNFEGHSFCTWKRIGVNESNKYDWSLYSGPISDGPTVDHTRGDGLGIILLQLRLYSSTPSF